MIQLYPTTKTNTIEDFINCVDKLLKDYVLANCIGVTYWWGGYHNTTLSIKFRMFINGLQYTIMRSIEESVVAASIDLEGLASCTIEDALYKLALIKKGV